MVCFAHLDDEILHYYVAGPGQRANGVPCNEVTAELLAETYCASCAPDLFYLGRRLRHLHTQKRKEVGRHSAGANATVQYS